MNPERLYVDNANSIRLLGYQDADTGEYVTNVTPSWTLKNAAGDTVASGDLTYRDPDAFAYGSVLWSTRFAAKQWPSDGHYTGTIPANTVLTDNAIYTLTITITGQTVRTIKYQARTRADI